MNIDCWLPIDGWLRRQCKRYSTRYRLRSENATLVPNRLTLSNAYGGTNPSFHWNAETLDFRVQNLNSHVHRLSNHFTRSFETSSCRYPLLVSRPMLQQTQSHFGERFSGRKYPILDPQRRILRKHSKAKQGTIDHNFLIFQFTWIYQASFCSMLILAPHKISQW